MTTWALGCIYTLVALSLIGTLTLTGRMHLHTGGQALFGVLLNILEAVAVWILWSHSTLEYATTIAVLLWVSELMLALYAIGIAGIVIYFSGRRAIGNILLQLTTVVLVSLLFFA